MHRDLVLPLIAAICLLVCPPYSRGQKKGDSRRNPKDQLLYQYIPAGTFRLGCSPADDDCEDYEKPAHRVTLTRGFWLGQTEVTQAAFSRVMGGDPSQFKGANRPVEQVTWTEAKSYCEAIGGRLPTEAEWEYAARGGSSASRYGNPAAVAWYFGNGAREPHDAARLQPNAFGLFDMLGNVSEWVADWSGRYSGAPAADPRGPPAGEFRVVRGGSVEGLPQAARASARDASGPDNRSGSIGFRCAWDGGK